MEEVFGIRSNWRGQSQRAAWPGIVAELANIVPTAPYEFQFSGPAHLLCVAEHGLREAGETHVGRLSVSGKHVLDGAMVFVPSGSILSGWTRLARGSSWIYLYIDPHIPFLASDLRVSEVELSPRLFFDDAIIRTTALKFKRLLEGPGLHDRLYAETLASLLTLELLRSSGHEVPMGRLSGGLSARCERLLCDYINNNISRNDTTLADLAKLAKLSPYHLTRAFKRSVGLSPHQYLIRCRIDRAKHLLADTERSITEIALSLGFASSSHFSVTFKAIVGVPPTAYRRSFG
jgi:AraC family transcriptional regulator